MQQALPQGGAEGSREGYEGSLQSLLPRQGIPRALPQLWDAGGLEFGPLQQLGRSVRLHAAAAVPAQQASVQAKTGSALEPGGASCKARISEALVQQ